MNRFESVLSFQAIEEESSSDEEAKAQVQLAQPEASLVQTKDHTKQAVL